MANDDIPAKISTHRPGFEALTSKLMHDLIAPLGALSHGVELLETSDDKPDDEILNVLKEAVDKALTQLMVFRAAWGKNGPRVVQGKDNLSTFLHRIVSIKKHRLANFSVREDVDQGLLRSGFCLLWLLQDALLPEGEVEFLIPSEDTLTITFIGRNTKSPEEITTALQEEIIPDEPSKILWHLTGEIIRTKQQKLSIDEEDDRLLLRLSV